MFIEEDENLAKQRVMYIWRENVSNNHTQIIGKRNPAQPTLGVPIEFIATHML
jgi:hypothetical protein